MATQNSQNLTRATWLARSDLDPILARVTPFVMPPVSRDALLDVANLVWVILCAGVPGDFVECGTWRGGTAFLMAELLKKAGVRDRKVWLCDSFEGMPRPEQIDGLGAIKEAQDPDSPLSAERSKAPVEEVVRTARELGLDEYTEFVKGWFQYSLPAARQHMRQIALLHVDCDWYSSVRCCLDNLYDRVVEGGFIFLDDYYHYDGCAIAVHEFLAERRLPYRIESVEGRDWGGCDYHYAARIRKGEPNWKGEHLLRLAAQDVKTVTCGREPIIVVGEEFRGILADDCCTLPFMERDGQYWGDPPDTGTAIGELERLRHSGAQFIAFPWTAFWWFDEYVDLAAHLERNYLQAVRNDRLFLFDVARPPAVVLAQGLMTG